MEKSPEDIIAIYGKRWDIEVFFKACKSILCLGKECHGLSYDALTAHVAFVFTRYLMLSLAKRENEDVRSLGGLFYAVADEMQDKTFKESVLLILDALLAGVEDALHPSEQQMETLLASFFGVGIPAAMGPFLFDLDYIVLDRLMAAHSDIALAAIGIVLKAERLPLNVGIGLCLGMVPLAAYNYSAKNYVRMQSVLKATRTAGIAISIGSIALYELFAPYLIRIFIKDPATVALGTDFLRIRVLATIMMFLSFIYVYFFQALGQGRMALFLVIMRWLMINIPMLFILDRFFGQYGLAWSQLVSDVLVAFLSWLLYRNYRKKHLLPVLKAQSTIL